MFTQHAIAQAILVSYRVEHSLQTNILTLTLRCKSLSQQNCLAMLQNNPLGTTNC